MRSESARRGCLHREEFARLNVMDYRFTNQRLYSPRHDDDAAIMLIVVRDCSTTAHTMQPCRAVERGYIGGSSTLDPVPILMTTDSLYSLPESSPSSLFERLLVSLRTQSRNDFSHSTLWWVEGVHRLEGDSELV
jgi:hypothetical protein